MMKIQVSFITKNLFEMDGISNKTIVYFFAKKTNDEIKKNYWCFSF